MTYNAQIVIVISQDMSERKKRERGSRSSFKWTWTLARKLRGRRKLRGMPQWAGMLPKKWTKMRSKNRKKKVKRVREKLLR